MILEKGEPLLTGIPAPNRATQITGHGSFREGKAQLLQFRVNLGSAPIRILLGQTDDQVPQFLGNLRGVILGRPPPDRDRQRQ
jgi:hypothetical protein